MATSESATLRPRRRHQLDALVALVGAGRAARLVHTHPAAVVAAAAGRPVTDATARTIGGALRALACALSGGPPPRPPDRVWRVRRAHGRRCDGCADTVVVGSMAAWWRGWGLACGACAVGGGDPRAMPPGRKP